MCMCTHTRVCVWVGVCVCARPYSQLDIVYLECWVGEGVVGYVNLHSAYTSVCTDLGKEGREV